MSAQVFPQKVGESSQVRLGASTSNSSSTSSDGSSNQGGQAPAGRTFRNGKEKAIAACLGALTTSLTMNPFDVIKTRLQTQHCTDPLFDPSFHASSTTTSHASVSLRSDAVAAASNNAVTRLIRQEGLAVLWRGVGPAMVISMPSQASYMVGYDLVRGALLDRPLPFLVSSSTGEASEIHKLGAPLVAGGLVRATIVSAFSPIELLRTRLQSLPPSSTFKQVTQSTFDVVRTDGVFSLWRGLPATLWRDVPFSAIYWASYEVMQRMLTGSGFGETLPQGGNQSWAVAFTSGAVSGSVAAICTNPFDVIKTRRQATEGSQRLGTFDLIRQLARRQGVKGLFSGLTPRLAKVAPACGLMISFYEIGLRWTLQAEEQTNLAP